MTPELRRKLRNILKRLFPDEASSRVVLDDAGIPAGNISFSTNAKNNWHAILKEAENRGKVQELVQIVLEEYPDETELQSYVEGGSAQAGGQAVAGLRTEEQDIEELMNFLTELVATGKIKEAITILRNAAGPISSDLEQKAILISSQYIGLVNDRNQGLISYENATISQNKIKNSLLNIINDIPQEIKIAKMMGAFTQKAETLSPDKAEVNKLLKQTERQLPQSDDELEKIIGQNNLVRIAWLTKALNASKSVCRIIINHGGRRHYGTGFLLKGGYLLTNNHVIPNKSLLENALVEFNYKEDIQGELEPLQRYTFEPGFYLTSPKPRPGGNPQTGHLDYTLVKLQENGKVKLDQWGFLQLETDLTPVLNDPVNIIQHPKGEAQHLAITANNVVSIWDHYLFYKADTMPGSSGSPVFDQNWKVIALHHAGKNERDGGMLINASGKRMATNRGILISDIVKDLQGKGNFEFLG